MDTLVPNVGARTSFVLGRALQASRAFTRIPQHCALLVAIATIDGAAIMPIPLLCEQSGYSRGAVLAAVQTLTDKREGVLDREGPRSFVFRWRPDRVEELAAVVDERDRDRPIMLPSTIEVEVLTSPARLTQPNALASTHPSTREPAPLEDGEVWIEAFRRSRATSSRYQLAGGAVSRAPIATGPAEHFAALVAAGRATLADLPGLELAELAGITCDLFFASSNSTLVKARHAFSYLPHEFGALEPEIRKRAIKLINADGAFTLPFQAEQDTTPADTPPPPISETLRMARGLMASVESAPGVFA